MQVTTLSAEARLADEVLGQSTSATGDELADLERRLAEQGDRHRARRLRPLRRRADEARAQDVLRGVDAGAKERLKIGKRLIGDKAFGLARRLLVSTIDLVRPADAEYLPLHQKATLATYKDPDLPLEWRLDKALEILERTGDLSASTDPESLGLAGAIFKRRWQVDNGRHHLERALFFYLRGYSQSLPAGQTDVLAYLRATPGAVLDARKDQGYTGINAAFVLDILAGLEDESAVRAGVTSHAAAERRDAARLIREEIVRSVPPLAQQPGLEWLKREWWFYATVGEAHFGLGASNPAAYGLATDWLVTRPGAAGLERRAAGDAVGGFDVPEWELESTTRQLASLALLHLPAGVTEKAFRESRAGTALYDILGHDGEAVGSAFRGKFGLALSGGGFRAALFHIGVLASLAERDLLRHVEVLSCVSGGSIIGAHYYLELRHLLQTKVDADIKAEHYVAIVERIATDFLTGVQRNVRMRVLAEWTTNLKMLLLAGYSRTLRVGELYEREIFRHVPDGGFTGPRWLPDWLAKWRGFARHRWLDELQVYPRVNGGQDKAFQPRNHNWRRRNKVPALVLNATSLNTGHCWQFTAKYMGEPPMPINTDVDANERLRRMWYDDAPGRHKTVRLGHAVAASSCVPGLFEPLTFDGLYPGRSVKLVDGGVCDNQGIWSLLEQDCTVTLVSDASGQMDSVPAPSSGVVGVPLRANSILQARIREAQFTDIAQRKRSLLLRGLMFLHLKSDLPAEQVAWIGCPASLKRSDFERRRDPGHDITSYGIGTDTQRRLAAIRTDLDSFNDIEAYALMASGYRMADTQLGAPSASVPGAGSKPGKGKWPFLDADLLAALRPESSQTDGNRQWQRARAVLDAGASLAFKIWKLSRVLRVVKWTAAAAACAAVGWLIFRHQQQPIAATVGSWITGAVASNPFGWRIPDPTFRDLAVFVASGIGMAILGAVLSHVLGHRYSDGVLKALQWRDTIRSIAIGAVMATVGFLIARLHLHVFDRWYLFHGRSAAIKRR